MAARVRPDSRDNLQELVLTQGDAAAMASVAQALQGALTNTRLAALPLALSRMTGVPRRSHMPRPVHRGLG